VTEPDIGVVVVLGPEGTALLVSAGSRSIRRALGPVAWSALEQLALSARRDTAGVLVVTVGVRDLAGLLGVGRDAAANALSRLRDLGLISASQQRAGRGRFDGTRHTILLPVRSEPSARSRTRSQTRRPAREDTRLTSLSLFDDVPSPSRVSVTDARDASILDHSTPVADDVPKKLHELAFDRMPTPRDAHGSGDGRSGGLSR
jgi:hypothetical protein